MMDQLSRQLKFMSKGWEVNWAHPQNTGTKVWARSNIYPNSHAAQWHWVTTGYLRSRGVVTPIYSADSWQIDWKKRNKKLVWGRNPKSKMPQARCWHWIDHSTLDTAGIKWQPAHNYTGRHKNQNGYIVLTRRGMTGSQILLADRYNLWMGRLKAYVLEHRIVAATKYGAKVIGRVVRHKNGVKDDNRPKNLLLGTSPENTADHNSARLSAMIWREKYYALLSRVRACKCI